MRSVSLSFLSSSSSTSASFSSLASCSSSRGAVVSNYHSQFFILSLLFVSFVFFSSITASPSLDDFQCCDDKCYLLVKADSLLTWSQALTEAITIDSSTTIRLAQINNADQQLFILNNILSGDVNQEAWIAGTSPTGLAADWVFDITDNVHFCTTGEPYCFWANQGLITGPNPGNPGPPRCRKLTNFGVWESTFCSVTLSYFIAEIDNPVTGDPCTLSRLELSSFDFTCCMALTSEKSCFFQAKAAFGLPWAVARQYARFAFSYNGVSGDLGEIRSFDQHLAIIKQLKSDSTWINLQTSGVPLSWRWQSDQTVVDCSGGKCLWIEGHTANPTADLAHCAYMSSWSADWDYDFCSEEIESFLIQIDDAATLTKCDLLALPSPGYTTPACDLGREYKYRLFEWKISKLTTLQAIDWEFGISGQLAFFDNRDEYLTYNLLTTRTPPPGLDNEDFLWIGGERQTLGGSTYTFGWRNETGGLEPFMYGDIIYDTKTCLGELCLIWNDEDLLADPTHACLIQNSGGWRPFECEDGADGYIAMTIGGTDLCSLNILSSLAEECCESPSTGCFDHIEFVFPIDWDMAQTLADSNLLTLATVYDVDEAFLLYNSFSDEPSWIGAKRLSGEPFKWQEMGGSGVIPVICGLTAYCVDSNYAIGTGTDEACVSLGYEGDWRVSSCSDGFFEEYEDSVRGIFFQKDAGPTSHTCDVNQYFGSDITDCTSLDQTTRCCNDVCYCYYETWRGVPYMLARDITKKMIFGSLPGSLARVGYADSTFVVINRFNSELQNSPTWIEGTDSTTEGTWEWENGEVFFTLDKLSFPAEGVCEDGVWCTWLPDSPKDNNKRNCLAINEKLLWSDQKCVDDGVYGFVVQYNVTGGTPSGCFNNFLAGSPNPLCCGGDCYARRSLSNGIPHSFAEFASKEEVYKSSKGRLATPSTVRNYLTMVSASHEPSTPNPETKFWIGGTYLRNTPRGFSWSGSIVDTFFNNAGCVPGKVCPFGSGEPIFQAPGTQCLYYKTPHIGVAALEEDLEKSCSVWDEDNAGYLVYWSVPGDNTSCPADPQLENTYCCNSTITPVCECASRCFELYSYEYGIPWNLALLGSESTSTYLADLREVEAEFSLSIQPSIIAAYPETDIWVGATASSIFQGSVIPEAFDYFVWITKPSASAFLAEGDQLDSDDGLWAILRDDSLLPSKGEDVRFFLKQGVCISPSLSISSTRTVTASRSTSSTQSHSSTPTLTKTLSMSPSSRTSASVSNQSPIFTATSDLPQNSPSRSRIIAPSVSSSGAKNTPIPTTPPTPKLTPTSTPSVVVCSTGESCDEEKKNPPCTDLNDPDCEEQLENCKKDPTAKECVPEEDEIVVKVPDTDKEQTYHVSTPGGGVLAEVKVDPKKLPKGATVRIKYIGGSKSDQLDKDTEEGCSSSSSLLSLGTVEVTAYDKNGKEIKNLDGNGIGVGFNIPNNGDDDEDVCVGSTDKDRDNWDCDTSGTEVEKKGKGVKHVKKKFNHLTSFAVFIGTNSGCGPWWIIAVSCIGGIPLLLALLVFLISRTGWGRWAIYGFKGKTLNQTIQKVETVQRASVHAQTGSIHLAAA